MLQEHRKEEKNEGDCELRMRVPTRVTAMNEEKEERERAPRGSSGEFVFRSRLRAAAMTVFRRCYPRGPLGGPSRSENTRAALEPFGRGFRSPPFPDGICLPEKPTVQYPKQASRRNKRHSPNKPKEKREKRKGKRRLDQRSGNSRALHLH